MTALMVCIRFSASSNTTDWGDSNTSSVTSISGTLTEDVNEGTKNANVIYTDIWVSMGEPDEVWETRIKLLKPYQVNAAAMNNAAPDAIFMHCLPSFHPFPVDFKVFRVHRRAVVPLWGHAVLFRSLIFRVGQPPLARISPKSSVSLRWRLRTRCLNPRSLSCSTRCGPGGRQIGPPAPRRPPGSRYSAYRCPLRPSLYGQESPDRPS